MLSFAATDPIDTCTFGLKVEVDYLLQMSMSQILMRWQFQAGSKSSDFMMARIRTPCSH